MHTRVLNFSARGWIVAGASALAVGAVLVLASHGVARQGTGATEAAQAACTQSAYQSGQPIVLADVDGTASTAGGELRPEYAQALDGVAATASSRGAYLIVDVFGSSVGTIQTLCATSTRIAAAAPLFATAQQTALKQRLGKLASRASRINTGASGSSIYGALDDGIGRVQALRAGSPVSAEVVMLSDGDEAADGIHLRRLLDGGATDREIAARIIGQLPAPDAKGLTIRIEGVGRLGAGRSITTRGVFRMQDIWQRICDATRPSSCSVTPDLLSTLS